MVLEVRRGRIADWSPAYGFVAPDDGGRQIFFCRASCAPTQDFHQLRRGDLVQFVVAPDSRHPGRLIARDLRWITGAEPCLRELDRRAARVGDPVEWAWRQRRKSGHYGPELAVHLRLRKLTRLPRRSERLMSVPITRRGR